MSCSLTTSNSANPTLDANLRSEMNANQATHEFDNPYLICESLSNSQFATSNMITVALVSFCVLVCFCVLVGFCVLIDQLIQSRKNHQYFPKKLRVTGKVAIELETESDDSSYDGYSDDDDDNSKGSKIASGAEPEPEEQKKEKSQLAIKNYF